MDLHSTLTFPIIVLASICTAAQHPDVEQPAEMFSRAVDHYNSARFEQARIGLAKLIERHPRHFRGYALYWDSVGKTRSATEQLQIVRDQMKLLRGVPVEARDEQFYYTILAGEKRLGREEEAESWRLEAIERIPRGLMAQQAKLKEAREEADVSKACGLFAQYMRDFPENVSWCQSAAYYIFERMFKNPTRFEKEDVVAAGRILDELTGKEVELIGNPRRLLLLRHVIARELLPFDAAQSAEFADRGIEFVAATERATDEFEASAARIYHEVALLARVELSQWDQAANHAEEIFGGTKLVEAIEPLAGASLFPAHSAYGEAELRWAHARVLAERGHVEAALEQAGYAAYLAPELETELEAMLENEAMLANPAVERRSWLESRVAAFAEGRVGLRRKRLLEQEVVQRAPAFGLLDLDGKEVSLSDFSGQVVLLSFWATWCGPCLAELDQLHKEYERLSQQSVAVIAVSVDTQKDKVPTLVAEKSYPFTIAYADGSIERLYGISSVPWLFVIDASGNIRFRRRGFRPGHFQEKLWWMVEAAGIVR